MYILRNQTNLFSMVQKTNIANSKQLKEKQLLTVAKY